MPVKNYQAMTTKQLAEAFAEIVKQPPESLVGILASPSQRADAIAILEERDQNQQQQASLTRSRERLRAALIN
jgi:hypothetical protein